MADSSLLVMPLLAGLLVLATHVPLGDQVLRRGIVFIDLAVAQVAALGSLIGGSFASDAWSLPLALAFALGGSLLMAALGRRHPRYREALIGLIYIAAATVAVLWVAEDPHGAQKLAATLSGDILWVTPGDLALLGVVSLAAWSVRLLAPGWSRGNGFYVLFAVLVTVSVQQLGLYLVFCTLIVPALATRHLLHAPVWAAYALGAAGYAGGLLLSLWFDWPSGAAVVLNLLVLGIACLLMAPSAEITSGHPSKKGAMRDSSV